jgi:cytosine/adenosine deaminase-related metal-dependent hydrolase
MAIEGGNQALGCAESGIAPGAAADFISLDATHPTLAGKSGDAVLDAWIFANGSAVDCVWVNGERLVTQGRHFARDAIAEKFKTAMVELLAG